MLSEERTALDALLGWITKQEREEGPLASVDALEAAARATPALWEGSGNAVSRCFFEWLKIREQEGQLEALSAGSLRADALHSSLLARLLKGQSVLDEAPPLNQGYPWHSLAEHGKGACSAKVLEMEDGTAKVEIFGHLWDIVSTQSEAEYRIQYPGSSGTYHLRRLGSTRLSPWEILLEE